MPVSIKDGRDDGRQARARGGAVEEPDQRFMNEL
jgi:hypothetical protein